MKRVMFILLVSIIIVLVAGCSSIDWSGFYAYTDTLHHDDGSSARVLRENLDKGYMTEGQVECWTQENYGWDNGCVPPTPVVIVSPIETPSSSFDCSFSEFKNPLTGRYIYDLSCE